jgi:hypothetical protein
MTDEKSQPDFESNVIVDSSNFYVFAEEEIVSFTHGFDGMRHRKEFKDLPIAKEPQKFKSTALLNNLLLIKTNEDGFPENVYLVSKTSLTLEKEH